MQIEVVVEVKLTGKPELEVALTVNGALPADTSLSAPKVMLWLNGFTLKLCDTIAAAE